MNLHDMLRAMKIRSSYTSQTWACGTYDIEALLSLQEAVHEAQKNPLVWVSGAS